MPFIQIALAVPPDPTIARRAAERVGARTHEILRKDPQVTAMAVQLISRDHWFVAGEPLSATGRNAFWVDIKITDATNTKDEMAAYVAAIFADMTDLLGTIEPESYVLVHGVPAYAYVYGGRTQERRF